MYMQIRLPLACLLIFCYCFWYYTRKRRLSTKASRAFTLLCVDTIINLLAATITEYTVNNRAAVDPLFNDVWHVIFLISITLWVALMLGYVLLLIERDGGGSQRGTKIAIAVVTSIVIVLEIALPIEYIDTASGSYSLGPKAYALYVAVSFVLVMLPYKAIHYRKVLGASKSKVLIASALVYIVIALIQMIWPHILLTSLAATMIVLGLMVNMEDTNLYVSTKTGLYNHFAFKKIAQEKLNNRKPLDVELCLFHGSESAIDEAMRRIDKKVTKSNKGYICCSIRHNELVVVPLSYWWRGHAPLNIDDMLDFDTSKMRCHVVPFHFAAGTDFNQVESAMRSTRQLYEDVDIKTDELTKLLRREAFIEQVNGMLERHEPLALLMIDIDDFKNINDFHGHDVGDEVLRRVSAIFRDAIRSTDIACRMGGDEFAVALAGVPSEANVSLVVNRIMESLNELVISDDLKFNVSVSVGAREYGPSEGAIDFETLYKQADEALYAVKRSGKNALRFYEV